MAMNALSTVESVTSSQEITNESSQSPPPQMHQETQQPHVQHAETGSVSGSGLVGMGGVGAHNKGLRRSPYLSTMAATKESMDLVEALSRPTPGLKRTSGGGAHGMGATAGPGGRSNFFDLKRPSSAAHASPSFSNQVPNVTPVSSSGTTHSEMTHEENESLQEGGPPSFMERRGSDTKPPTFKNSSSQARMPSIRSALRVSSARGGQVDSDVVEGNTGNVAFSSGGMKSVRSVTFSSNTKKASIVGIGEGQANPSETNQSFGQLSGSVPPSNLLQMQMQRQQANSPEQALKNVQYSAAMMMKKSQSIASPEFLRARNGAIGSNSGSEGNTVEDGGNAQFPIYFAKLDPGQQQQQAAQEPEGTMCVSPSPPPNNGQSPPGNHRLKSKSMTTLQYYYKNANSPENALLAGLGMKSIPSNNGMNLTFRDMLDEGDGSEGDLNVRHRNQQWKDFRNFSDQFGNDGTPASTNPMIAKMMAKKNNATGGLRSSFQGGSITGGNKRGVESFSQTVLEEEDPNAAHEEGRVDEAKGGSPENGNLEGNPPMSKRSSLTSTSNLSGPGSGQQQQFAPPMRPNLLGSHRAAVSVNDLAVLRRAAARMKGSNGAGGGASNWGGASSTQQPGQTLGGDMLSRIPSGAPMTGVSGPNTPKGGSNLNNKMSSPLAQMMAAKSTYLSSQQQQELLQMKFTAGNMTMATGGIRPSASHMNAASLMGRRVRTVGAGLAYGGANCVTAEPGENGSRLSRFDLGNMGNSRLGLSSGLNRQGSAGGGQNESWD